LFLLLANATSHAGVLAIVLALGFVLGVFGHIIRSRTMILTALIVIAAVSSYFLIAGEAQTFSK
jgi:hypothetical protein